MTLEELLYGLTTVILSYHDKQVTDPTIKIVKKIYATATEQGEAYRKAAQDLYCSDEKYDPTKTHEKKLRAVIHEFTSLYPSRKTLYEYLFEQINYIKNMLDRKEPCSKKQLTDDKFRLLNLFCDFKTLLTSNKDITRTLSIVDPNNRTQAIKTYKMSGLIDNGWVPKDPLCFTGRLIINEIFQLFNLSIDTPQFDKFAKRKVKFICDNQQNKLYVPHLQEEGRVQAQKIRDLQDESTKLSTAILFYKNQINPLITELQELKIKNRSHEELNTKVKSEKASLESTIDMLKMDIKKLEIKISELVDKLTITESENTSLQDKNSRYQEQINTLNEKSTSMSVTIVNKKTEIGLLEDKILELQSTITESDNLFKTIEEEKTSLEKQISEQSTQISTLEEANRALSKELAQKEEEKSKRSSNAFAYGGVGLFSHIIPGDSQRIIPGGSQRMAATSLSLGLDDDEEEEFGFK